MMKKKAESHAVLKKILALLPRFHWKPAVVTGTAFIISVLAVLSRIPDRMDQDIEVGRVAEREIIADRPFSYVDEEATRIRRTAQQHLVPAVFVISHKATEDIQKNYADFADFSRKQFAGESSPEYYRLSVQSEFPRTAFVPGIIENFFSDPARDTILECGSVLLSNILETGLFALPKNGLENYHPILVELIRENTSHESLNYREIVTLESVGTVLNRYSIGEFPEEFRIAAFNLVKSFLAPNTFFSATDTELLLTRLNVEPIKKQIEQGEIIIRKGFIVNIEDWHELQEFNRSAPSRDTRTVIGEILILLLLYGLLILLGTGKFGARALNNPEIYLVSVLVAVYMTGGVLVGTVLPASMPVPVAFILPTALVIMLPAILICAPFALGLSIVLPLAVFVTGVFDISSFIFATASGVVASILIPNAKKRMDLIKDGLIISGANCIVALAILLTRHTGVMLYPVSFFWAAFNGVISGILVVGLLPPLEHILNVATDFRLIELSDLNTPTLKKLFSAAPGTYSHSIMVANLAEAACQDIGAHALLARIGAYYHDIGKMSQPQYFVENQGRHNPHDDIPPRLSATIIRSHVKIGAEKAHSIGLPRSIIDIISEHHGNSVISFFFRKAAEQDPNISAESFSYPGTPPRSRESAVVMLADTCEAAVRTLEKPSAEAIEKLVQKLVNDKVDHRQLANSELTFLELEDIKRSFVKVLTAYYHSRIKYPETAQKAT
ncbi:HD family phosphohydrolase [Spirochaetia bacterium]|nr:HD family phosphohydrolase [Spirochaetia bacterium]